MSDGPAAVIWDVDGTLAETERDGHRVAFNLAFEAEGLPWRWEPEHYGALLRIAGGRERLLHDLAARPDSPATPAAREALAHRLHARKTAFYTALAAERPIPLRDGVRALLDECRARGVALGIATTTTRANVAALLAAPLGRDWEAWFGVIVSGDDVARKKPDPEVYHRALAALGVAPGHALAIEDSPDGARAALAAGVPVIVTRSAYFAHDPLPPTAATGPGLHARAGWQPAPAAAPAAGDDRITFDDLRHWWAAVAATAEE